ncbi:MAG TPA: serine/threonine-protein kinase, partial [Pirellulales bacterium]|nr:serine/threonine-protein kinase [Pirellulales bacterium]
MPTVAQFWKLAVESRLISPQASQQLAEGYARAGGAAANDAAGLAQWLVAKEALSAYQAKLLMAGRKGPFVFGDYVTYDRVEEGRLAGLFRARHAPTNHPVCLYFLAGPGLQDRATVARIAPAVSAADAVSRGLSNLVRCYQWCDLGAFKFIVLEDLRGESLGERLARGNKLSPREACRIVRGAAVGLVRLHAQGQTHAEIRPANIWLSQGGTVKLLGFPLARDPIAGPKTPGDADTDYLAPELIPAGAQPDPRSDMYALGCVLYQLLAGQVPFAGGDARQKAARKSSETPTACDRINPAVPAALARVVGYMMHKNPDQRYQQATNVVEALAAYTGAEASQNGAAADASSDQAFEAWLKQPSPPAQAAREQDAVGRVMRAAQAPVAVSAQPPLAARPAAARPAQPHSVQAHSVQPHSVPSHSVQPHPAQGGVAVAQAPVAVQVPRAVAVQVPVASPTVSFDPVGTGQTSLAARLAGPRRKKPVMTYVVLGGAGLVAAAVTAFMVIHANPLGEPSLEGQSPQAGQSSTASVDANGAEGSNAAANPSPEESAAEPVVEPAMEAITSIGELIWEPPTSGQPLDLAYLAPGAQVVVAVRPAALMKHAEWEKLADPRTLGTVSRWLTADLREQAGTPLENIELAIIGLIDASPAPPRVVMVLHPVEELVADDVAQAWGDARAEDVEGAAIRVQGERAFYLPAE